MKTDRKDYAQETLEGLFCREGAFEGKTFEACLLRNCDFTKAEFGFCKFLDCRFESCNLSLAKLRGSVFSGTTFKDSKLVGVNWTEAHWPRIRLACPVQFENCLLNDSVFLGLSLRKTRLARCQARGADFRETDLTEADLSHTDFSGALFGGTNLTGANLVQARDYAIRAADNKLKDAKFSLPEAMALLYCLDIKIV
ncbi:MAG: pentapeptide repeat-containing protein [Elusimicrobiales bacterium]|nr:pentapeptide repeat-containing protein [Elusimicrobiales bacterium]